MGRIWLAALGCAISGYGCSVGKTTVSTPNGTTVSVENVQIEQPAPAGPGGGNGSREPQMIDPPAGWEVVRNHSASQTAAQNAEKEFVPGYLADVWELPRHVRTNESFDWDAAPVCSLHVYDNDVVKAIKSNGFLSSYLKKRLAVKLSGFLVIPADGEYTIVAECNYDDHLPPAMVTVDDAPCLEFQYDQVGSQARKLTLTRGLHPFGVYTYLGDLEFDLKVYLKEPGMLAPRPLTAEDICSRNENYKASDR